MGLTHASTGAATNSSISKVDSGAALTSRLGFIGTEDLGGGLSSMFHLEMALAPDTGGGGSTSLSGLNAPIANSIFSRSAYVGLKGALGTVKLGRQTSSTIEDHFNASAIITGINTGIVSADFSQGIVNDLWQNNMIKYESPDFNGFSFKGHSSLGEVAGNSSYNSSLGGILIYGKGGLRLTVSNQKDYDATGKSLTWQYATASYTFGAVKLAGGINRVNHTHGAVNLSPYAWNDSKAATFGANYRMTEQLAFAAQYFRVSNSASNTSSNLIVLNADYALSKRTSLYALLGASKNGAIPIMPIYGTASAANASGSGVTIGMLHKF